MTAAPKTLNPSLLHEALEQPFARALEAGDEAEARAIAAHHDELRSGFHDRIAAKFGVSLEAPREIMGREFLGTEAAEKTFGRKLRPEEIPPVPFSQERLQRAQKLGQFLKLDVDKAGNGKPATMQQTDALLQKRFNEEGKGKVLRDAKGWYKNEAFFTEDAPRLCWRLVGKEVIPGSLDEKAVVQTRVLRDYVKEQVFAGQEMPSEYAAALQEFDEQEAELTQLIGTDWKECCRRLAALKLNQMCRRTPNEALADSVEYFDNNGQHLLENTFDRTTRLSSDGSLVVIGRCDSAGARVDYWHPSRAHPAVGVVFSCSR